MARIITQETFNEVVKENMEEFEMSQEEAIEEARTQFQAQGVNLGNIIMACTSAAVVSKCIKALQEQLYDSNLDNDESISHELTILKIELNKELAVRVHAGKEGLYSLLIDCLSKIEPDYLLLVLETLTIFMNGYPDLLDKTGLDFMLAFLQKTVDPPLIIQNLKWMKNCITKHEKNRSDLILLNIQDKFRTLLLEFPDKSELIIQICQVTKKLVSDDDVRVVHGNPHEHARALAREILTPLVKLLDKNKNDSNVLGELLSAIYALIVREELCMQVHEEKGLTHVLNAMVTFPDDEKINRQCLLLLKGLAGSDRVKDAIIQNGSATLIIGAMNRHKSSPNLTSSGCMCIAALALRSPQNSQALVDAGAPDTLISVLNFWKDNQVILKNACSAIRNQVSRCPRLRDEYIQLGVEEILDEIKEKSGNLDFESKGVLRDLGCDVKFEEQWRGEGRQLAD